VQGVPCAACVRFTIRNDAAAAVTISGFSPVNWSDPPNHLVEVSFPGPIVVWMGNDPAPAYATFFGGIPVGASSTVDMDLTWSRDPPPPAPIDVTFSTDREAAPSRLIGSL
jgi:hypothetical protein